MPPSKPKAKPAAPPPPNMPDPEVLRVLQERYNKLNPVYVPRSAGFHAAEGGLYPIGGSGPLYPQPTTDLGPKPGEYPLATTIRIPTTLPDGSRAVAEYRIPGIGPLTDEQQNSYDDQKDKEALNMSNGKLY